MHKKIALMTTIFIALFVISFTSKEAKAEEVDTTPPVLKKLELSSSVVQAGDKLTVYVTAEDDISGISSVFVTLKSPLEQSNGHLYLKEDSTGRFTASMTIDENTELGEWSIGYISIEDNANNFWRSFYQEGYAYKYDNFGNYECVEQKGYTFTVIAEQPPVEETVEEGLEEISEGKKLGHNKEKAPKKNVNAMRSN